MFPSHDRGGLVAQEAQEVLSKELNDVIRGRILKMSKFTPSTVEEAGGNIRKALKAKSGFVQRQNNLTYGAISEANPQMLVSRKAIPKLQKELVGLQNEVAKKIKGTSNPGKRPSYKKY